MVLITSDCTLMEGCLYVWFNKMKALKTCMKITVVFFFNELIRGCDKLLESFIKTCVVVHDTFKQD